jgi:uncharacterized protein YceK
MNRLTTLGLIAYAGLVLLTLLSGCASVRVSPPPGQISHASVRHGVRLQFTVPL